MTSRTEADLVKRLRAFVSTAAVFSMVFGLSGLAGWVLNLPALATWGDETAMAPNAAACFLLAGLSLLLLGEGDKQPFTRVRKMTARASAFIVGLVGLLTLAELMSGRNLGIDQLLLVRSPGPPIAAARIVMSPVAAGAFLLLSLALLVIDWRTRGEKWPAQFICLAAAFAPVFGVLGWILGPGAPPITLPWPAVVAFAMLTAAFLCSRATWAMGGILTRQRPGARMWRGAFPAVLLVLCVLGWLLSKPLLSGVHFTWAEVTVLAIVTGSMIAGFIGWTTFIVDRSDRERKRLEDALQLRQEHLDRLLNAMEEPETEARLRKLVKAGVAGALLLTGLLGMLSWRMALQAAEDADWVAHAHEVSATLELTLRHVVDVETGARGFALTGHEPFLEPYNSGSYAVSLDLQTLRTLVVEPDQIRRLDVLVKQAMFRLGEAADLVAARRQSGETPAIARLTQGKQATDAVRSTVQEMEDQEKLLLEQRTQHARGTRRFTSSAIGLGSILGIIFLSIAGLTVSREIRVAARAQAQVKSLNADLERRVEQRTAALEAEAAARLESEGRLAAVIKFATDSIITVDDGQRIVLFNQAAEKMFDCSRSEAMGRPIKGFIPHMSRFGEDGFTNQAVGLQDALWAVRANGEKFQIEASISENEIAGHQMFTVILRDVSERKETEVRLAAQAAEVVHSRQALETQKLMLQSVLNSMVEGLVATDEQGNFILWNPAAEEILGLGPANLSPADWSAHYGMFLPDMITPFPNEQNPLLLAIAGEVTSAVMFIRNPSLEQGVWIESNGAPLRDKDGLVRGGVIAFRDITRRKADELEIRKLNEDLEDRIAKRIEQLAAANHELEAFSYSVSHDLRAPLRHIAGFSRILVNDFGPVMAVEAREYLQRIEDAVRHMGLLVEDLLSLAKLGQQSLKLCRTELNAIVDAVISILEPECEGREVEWHIAKLPALDCDPILMAQVFQNLLGNALKYSRNRAYAVIEVDSIQQPGKPPVIFVRDNGAGFNRKYADRLFGVFQRFHTDSEFEGTGVGLATVHRIIQKHGGTIWAESEPDHGATFYFALQMTDQIVATPKATADS
jgi:PAS domain S-box-containing protein